MKFFIYSDSGDALALGIRLKEEGNEACIFIRDKDTQDAGQGLIEHVENVPQALARKPDCVVFDMVGLGMEADRLRKVGLNVIGGGSLQDRMEHERTFGMDFARRLGVRMPEFKQFKHTDIDAARDYVAKTRGRYVLKPDDNKGGTALTYVSRSPDDMLQFLEWCEKARALKVDFILQKFVPGIEISTEVWFAQGVPVSPPNGTMELKKLMSGDVGPNTGCMASIVWGYHMKEPRIVQQTIKKMYPALQAVRYTGPLDVNAIVAEEDGRAYFLEFTPRFGYSAIYALAELFREDVGSVLYGISTGQLTEMKLKDGFGMAVRLAVPPYPLHSSREHHKTFLETAGRRVRKLPDGHCWLLDVRTDEGNLVTAGVDGVVCEITYSGLALQAVADKIYDMIEHTEIPDVMYRTDGAERAMRELPMLKAMGYEVPDVGGKNAAQPRRNAGPQGDSDQAIGEKVPVGGKA